MTTHQCLGEPEGSCPTIIPVERVWCRFCTDRRQRSIAQGLPIGIPTPVSVILEDIESPKLQCQCGGMADGYRHEQSLLHRRWVYGESRRRDNGAGAVS